MSYNGSVFLEFNGSTGELMLAYPKCEIDRLVEDRGGFPIIGMSVIDPLGFRYHFRGMVTKITPLPVIPPPWDPPHGHCPKSFWIAALCGP